MADHLERDLIADAYARAVGPVPLNEPQHVLQECDLVVFANAVADIFVPQVKRLRDENVRLNAALAKYEADDVRYLAELRRLAAEVETLRQALMKAKTCALPTEVRDVVNAALRGPAINAARPEAPTGEPVTRVQWLRELLDSVMDFRPEGDGMVRGGPYVRADSLLQAAEVLAARPESQTVALTVETAPLGTKAPAYIGGHWTKTLHGWKWCTGSTFPRPGGDWTGELIPPEEGKEGGA